MKGAVPITVKEESYFIQKEQKLFANNDSQIIMQKQQSQTTIIQDKRNQKATKIREQNQKINQYSFLTSSLLRDLIEQDIEINMQSDFESTTLKDVDLENYIKYIHSKTKFSPQCLIIALIYIDRYNLQNEDFNLSQYNVHKLLLTCLLLATKYHDEIYYDNKAFQHGGGISNVKLFQLELKVFQSLGFNLHIDQQYYFQFLNSLYKAYLITEQQQQEEIQNQSQRT